MDTHGRNASRFGFLDCGLYSLAMLAQPDRRTGPSLIPRGAFLAHLGAARLERGRSLRPSGLEPATGAAVAALIPAIIRVILIRRWYYIVREAIFRIGPPSVIMCGAWRMRRALVGLPKDRRVTTDRTSQVEAKNPGSRSGI